MMETVMTLIRKNGILSNEIFGYIIINLITNKKTLNLLFQLKTLSLRDNLIESPIKSRANCTLDGCPVTLIKCYLSIAILVTMVTLESVFNSFKPFIQKTINGILWMPAWPATLPMKI
uniref:Uncharacterized protein n=1 Tax=Glossina brevipalpis TaxID=37001 RepID=A0A1A9X4L0_9MUSC